MRLDEQCDCESKDRCRDDEKFLRHRSPPGILNKRLFRFTNHGVTENTEFQIFLRASVSPWRLIVKRASEIDLRADLEHPTAEDLQRPQPLPSICSRISRRHVENVARVEQVVEVSVSSDPQLRYAEAP